MPSQSQTTIKNDVSSDKWGRKSRKLKLRLTMHKNKIRDSKDLCFKFDTSLDCSICWFFTFNLTFYFVLVAQLLAPCCQFWIHHQISILLNVGLTGERPLSETHSVSYSYSVLWTLRKILHFCISSSFCLTRDFNVQQRRATSRCKSEMVWNEVDLSKYLLI